MSNQVFSVEGRSTRRLGAVVELLDAGSARTPELRELCERVELVPVACLGLVATALAPRLRELVLVACLGLVATAFAPRFRELVLVRLGLVAAAIALARAAFFPKAPIMGIDGNCNLADTAAVNAEA